MTEKFQNEYSIVSARLKNWDYGKNGIYFITIYTKNRSHFLDETNQGQLIAIKLNAENKAVPKLKTKNYTEHIKYTIKKVDFQKILTLVITVSTPEASDLSSNKGVVFYA